MSSPLQPPSGITISMLGDHPVLNLLNTVARIDDSLVDAFQSDQDVLEWLAQSGWPVEPKPILRPAALLHAARSLRETIRSLVEKKKAGKRISAEPLNAFLAEASSYLELVPEKNGGFTLQRRWQQNTAQQILAPIAEAAAELFATGDFNLVKHCEDQDCVLWFYDRTRSHHRRWCSMALCGNRHKVAAFRKRRQKS